MKIATGIISLTLMIIAFGVSIYGVFIVPSNTGGYAGLTAFLFLIGGSFSFKLPGVSFVIFSILAILELLAGITSGLASGITSYSLFLIMWGIISLGLGIVSFFSLRADRREKQKSTLSI